MYGNHSNSVYQRLGPILDATMVSATRDNLDKFEFRELGLTWHHFDPMEGVTLRVIYSAPSMSDITLDGYAAEAGSPVRFAVNDAGKPLKFSLESPLLNKIALFFVGAILIAYSLLIPESRGRGSGLFSLAS